MSASTPRPTVSRRPGLVAFTLAAAALVIGSVWLANAFLRFGPLELVPSLWIDYPSWALDFGAYHSAAGRVAADGTPYTAETVEAAFESGPPGLYYYAPVLAVSLVPLAELSVADASVWWFVAQMATLVLACALMPVRVLVRLLAFGIIALSPAVTKDVVYGNVSTLLLLPTVMAWRWMDRPLGSIGIALAMSIRPSLGLLLIWQLLRRQWHAVAWTIGAGVVVVMLTLPWVGIAGYLDYLAVIRNLNIPTAAAGETPWENHDLGTVARSLGASPGLVDLVRIGTLVGAAAAILLSLRRDREVSFMVTLMASMLFVPLLWDHYLTLLLLPAAFVADRWRPLVIALPLLAWVPQLSVFAVILAMLLPFLVPDRTAREADASAAGLPSDPAGGLPRRASSV